MSRPAHEARAARTSVSAVIPHYGSADPTIALVDRLRACAELSQIIVADDASPVPFPDLAGVEVVRRAVNGGFGSAVNSGAAAAHGDLLLVLNSDLEVDPATLDAFLREARDWLPAVVAPAVVDPAGVPDFTGRHFPTVGHQAVEWLLPLARFRQRTALHEAVGHDTRAVPGAVTSVDWLVGAILLMPMADFRAVGGFDERFYMNSEEVDLQRRLRERGVPSIYLGNHQVVHEGGGSSAAEHRRRWVTDSRWVYADKWGGTARLRAALSAATGANLLWNAGRAAAGRDTTPLATARAEWQLIWGGR